MGRKWVEEGKRNPPVQNPPVHIMDRFQSDCLQSLLSLVCHKHATDFIVPNPVTMSQALSSTLKWTTPDTL